MSAQLPHAQEPAEARTRWVGPHAYGWLLLLILASLSFQLAAPDDAWARAVTIVLQGLTLVLALWGSGAPRAVVRIGAVAVVLAIAGSFGILIGSGEIGAEVGRVLPLAMVLLAPPAIVSGLVRETRAAGSVTVKTMFGVLCIYLLVGAAFSFAYGAVAAFSGEPFFSEVSTANQSDFLYFSFTTLTTTGYGDLTAAQDVGRSFAITEALIGQIYLVTVVALIVANIRPRRVGAG